MNPGILEYSKHAWDVNLNGNSTTIVMNWFQEVSKMFVFYTFSFKFLFLYQYATFPEVAPLVSAPQKFFFEITGSCIIQ